MRYSEILEADEPDAGSPDAGSMDRIEPDGDGYQVIFNGKPFAHVVPHNDGWVVRLDQPTSIRRSAGSRVPQPSPRAAFSSYFKAGRSYTTTTNALALQLPGDPPNRQGRQTSDLSGTLSDLVRQHDAAKAEADQADTDWRSMWDRLPAHIKNR